MPVMIDGMIQPGAIGTQSASNVLPDSVKQAAAQAPQVPKPVYNGSTINSIPHVANSLGAQYNYNSATNTHTVNGNPIQPTSMVNGTPHASVAMVAHAAGVPTQNVQQTASTTTVMPHNNQSPQYQQDVSQYGQYNADVLANGAFRDPKAYGETVDQAKQHEADMYGIPVSAVQVTAGGHTYVDPKYVRAYLEAKNAQQTPAPPSYQDQLNSLGTSFMQQVNGSAPVAPTLPQLPTLDMSHLQPFSFDPNQDFMNQYNAQLPAFQGQLATADQKINDQMNARGMYNSGVAQQDVDNQNQALYGKLFDSIQKNSLADQKQAFTEYQGQVSNYLNGYKAQLDAAYKAGQLTNQQYADAINEWGKQVSAAQNVFDQQAKQILDSQSQDASMQQKLIPYNYGPTPYQQQQLDLNQLKALLPYQSPTAYQQGQLNISQQKLQMQLAQDQVVDQQKWAQIMGVGPDGSPTLDMQKLQEQTNKDLQAAQTAAANASNNQVRTQITALHDQLVAASGFITNLTTQGVKATDPQMTQAISNYNTINAEIKAIADSSGPSDTSSYSGPLPQPN